MNESKKFTIDSSSSGFLRRIMRYNAIEKQQKQKKEEHKNFARDYLMKGKRW